MILTFMVCGARPVISFCMRSLMPGNMVVPPDRTVLAYRSLRMSTSHFMMELYVHSWMPLCSMPMVMTWPSGSSYSRSSVLDSAAVCISASKS